ncbi:LPXTG cell wall anchor domain-containing protein [Proteiniphilum sp.]|uniref:LPXTG cell wall anchor domain-containing protein n=1 Tax=Proteiniphilum sp. TaxID=1926877 RepID=UPI002B217089|nr:LPXTG cell wall anchor domain-containing protein [Proteiniphilum sp.]MEA4916647.1 LPXTG cell wall anchor domain-containing protein [Proteiniphilum sp.]
MSRKIERHILLPVALLLYFAVMAAMAYPRYKVSGNWGEYFGVIGVCLLFALLLFFILKRRKKIRARFSKKDLNQ